MTYIGFSNMALAIAVQGLKSTLDVKHRIFKELLSQHLCAILALEVMLPQLLVKFFCLLCEELIVANR